MEKKVKHPVVTISNGLRVANFSSPHAFTFEDGTVLPACDAEVSKLGTLDQKEIIYKEHDQYVDIHLEFALNDKVVEALKNLQSNPEVDIILVPFPVLEAIKASDHDLFTQFSKVKVIRVKDRMTKAIHTDKFCI